MLLGAAAGAAGGLVSGGLVIGAVAGGAGSVATTLLNRGLAQLVDSGTARLRRGIQEELVEAVFTRLPHVERRMRELEQATGQAPTPTDVNVTAEYVSR